MSVRTETGLIRAHAIAALASVVYVALAGLTVAIKFHNPDWLTSISWLTWGRLRYVHTQGVFFGWLGNAFLMFLYDAVPRLARRPVASRKLGWALFITWNFLLVLPGWALLQLGFSQPLEWAEFPPIVDVAAVVGMFLACVQFVAPFFKSKIADLYVSSWYVMGGLTFTLLAYPVGNIVPELLPGARRDVQRALDSRRGRAFRHAARGRHRLRGHSGNDRKTDLQPLPIDDRLLAFVSGLSAQRNASLYILINSHGGSNRRDRRLCVSRRGRDLGGDEPASFAPRFERRRRDRRAFALYLGKRRQLSRGQFTRVSAIVDAP